ncbi:metalloendopeptidase [Coemansia sp. S16]|nr:metalloendopeptidase [Coemansia sp. S16]
MSTSSAAKDTILDFNLSPADIERGTDALEQGKRAQDSGAAQTNPTFANVIIPLATYENEGCTLNVSTDKDICDATSMAAEEKLDELEGTPQGLFEGRATEVVDGQEGFVVMTKYPDIIPVMKMAKHEETRELALRLEAAQLLGYKTHAEFVLEENMAKAPVPVLEFEEDLLSRLNVLADTEIEEIEALKKADKQAAGKPYAGLFGWDYRYYSNLVKERKHNINDEEVKQYFPIKEVTRSILDIYQNMLSLRFVKIDNPPVWHADVEMYEVWEATEETFVGHFYLDLFPREGKYNHAAVWPIRAGFNRPDGSREYPVAAMVANFPKPTPSAPALLTHDDATTLLHELGHVFHGICSVTKWALFHGTRTERDFVEAPSQMLENWSWEPSVLQKFSMHHQTGKPIPEVLVKRHVAAKNEDASLFNLRQLFFGLYDMGIHNTADGKVDTKELYNKLYEDIARFKIGSHDTWGIATIGHMMGGYDAGYYGYMWSQVFSADMYASRFVKDAASLTHRLAWTIATRSCVQAAATIPWTA